MTDGVRVRGIRYIIGYRTHARDYGVDHVVSVDLHSAQIDGFFKPQIPVDNHEAFPVGAVYFLKQTLGEPIVVAPHSAAVIRAAKFRDTLSRTIDEFVPLAFVIRKHQLDKHQPGDWSALQTLENCKELDKLVTTNTIPMHFKANEQSSKIVRLSVAPFFAEVIYCIHTKSSIIQVLKTT
ncbi:hypothetical protein PsorP6_003734 [Peronosclerospora sorghi]|uniref:Uncharacterized protein n=1 Tax=Peronosclerospora sorghi TaxID=230839 RepID=A0ACC0VL47_9STRA|nr:hypothetical protein PsorP6_003734 [Peronosclerospora sorghi]